MGAARSTRTVPPRPTARVPDTRAVGESLRRLIEEVAAIPATEIRDDSSLDSDLAMDSMSLVSLQVAIEEHFGIRFDLEDLEETRRFDAIAARIHQRCIEEAR